jgi:CRP-like cAMP-binding protein
MPARVKENYILKRLEADDLAALRPNLKPFTMVRGTVVHRSKTQIDQVYFPLNGMISILAVTKSGEQIETAVVGREGVVGASIGSLGPNAFGQATVQISGEAVRIQSGAFIRLFNASERFRLVVTAFQASLFLQAQQAAACHALHTVEARLCRWLLQSQDVIEGDTIELTQEFLSHMLGVHRPAVTVAAVALQKLGLIEYSRGVIEILDRPGLKKRACECYEVFIDGLIK